jgi:pimeloyl-ACP methyl ester carboxylesterase
MAEARLTAASVRLRDGRALAFSAAGPADGLPIVYLHGAIGSPLRVSDELAAVLEDLRLRWICVQRPGFGGSDPRPGRTMLGFARDVEELANALAIPRLAVLGVSAGGPYALACGQALGGLVGAVAVCSSLSPLCAPHDVAGVPAHVRAALRLVASAPGPTARTLDAGVGVIRRRPGLALRAMTAGAPAADRRLLDDDEASSTAVAGLLAATLGGVAGLVADYLVCCAPWGFALQDVGVPVDLWHGVQDRLVPVEHAWQLAAALPACRPAFDPDEGHFFFRRRARQIVARLVDLSFPRPPRGRARGGRRSAGA